MRTRFHLANVATVAAAVALTGCVPITTPRHRDELVTVTEHTTVKLLNVHASTDTEILTIWGRDFPGVRGRNPCYLRIPGRPLILFVTSTGGLSPQATVHLANTDTHRIVDFPAHDSRIGSDIGEAKAEQFERVVSVDGDTLLIEGFIWNRRYRYYIDLARPRFVREEMDWKDMKTGQPRTYVLEEGKAPRSSMPAAR